MVIVYLAIWCLMGYICHNIAKKNGRNEVLAIFMGFLLGLIAVVVYLIIGKTKELKEQEQRDLYNKFKTEENS